MGVDGSHRARGGFVDERTVALQFDGESTQCRVMEFVGAFGREMLGPRVGLLGWRIASPEQGTAFALSSAHKNIFGKALCSRGSRSRVLHGDVRCCW